MTEKLRVRTVSNKIESFLGKGLAEVAQSREHDFKTLSFMTMRLEDIENSPLFKELLHADVVYYRTGPGPVFAKILEEYLAKREIPKVGFYGETNPYIHRKSFQMFTVGKAGLPVPKTVLSVSKSFEEMRELLGERFVAKEDVGLCGNGVKLIESALEYEKVPVNWKRGDYIFQEFIPHEFEVRTHIVGGKVASWYMRRPKKGDFRTNLSQGGFAGNFEDTEMIKKILPMAEAIAKLFSMEIGAVDFLPKKNNGALYFLEANVNPGWSEVIQRATGSDMASLIMDYLEKVAKEGR